MVEIDKKNSSHYIGEKYEETKGMDIADIAKLVRKDLKENVFSKKLPDAKYSVRIKRFAGGQSLTVEITTENKLKNRNGVHNSIEKIINEYNYYAGDPMSDYWNGNFFEHVDFFYIKDNDRRMDI